MKQPIDQDTAVVVVVFLNFLDVVVVAAAAAAAEGILIQSGLSIWSPSWQDLDILKLKIQMSQCLTAPTRC